MQYTVLHDNPNQTGPAELGALDAQGRLRLMPASFYQQFSQEAIAIFAVKHGLYSLPTEELAAYLRRAIGTRSALEIGAGHGALAAALGIRATDNHMQTWPEIAQLYKNLGQAVVPYGAGVEALDALEAVTRYQPEVVLACWVTHRYDASEHDRGGNMYGVDEVELLRQCKTYIHVGNAATHANKKILALAHRRYTPSWLVSRSMRPLLNEIRIWGEVLEQETCELLK